VSNVDFTDCLIYALSCRISSTFKYSRRHRRYFYFIIYWTIGVKIPAPARLLCVAVPHRKNWSRLYARFIKRRKKLYVCIRSRVSGGNTRANQFRTAKVYEAGIRWRARFVYTGLSVVRFLPPSIALSSLSAICTFNPRDIDPPTWLCHLSYYFVPTWETWCIHVVVEM